MKNKIENLIKKDFIDLLIGCTISLSPRDIDYKKDGELLFYYNKKKNYFHFNYEIWSNFESRYDLNQQELSDLLVGIVEDVLNYKGVTPESIHFLQRMKCSINNN